LYRFLAFDRVNGYKRGLRLSLYNAGSTETAFKRFTAEKVLDRLRALDARARVGGLAALRPADDLLVAIGTESDADGHVTKNSYGIFNLSWQAQEHPEWAEKIAAEIDEIRGAIRETHGVELRYLIWAGMGGSIEDKSMYQALGLLKGGPRFYALDSTDPAKLKHILADMQARSKRPLGAILRSTLVVGMAMGMTSYEPVVNLEKLSALYAKHAIDSRPNFLYMTLPGSLLDQFAGPRGYRKVELQLDDQNSTAGRHSGPLTRGSLYPLALAGVDLRSWIAGTFLSADEIETAWQLAAFIHTQGEAGRDKLTLALPKAWAGAALWTKQDFEESLGKSETSGLKVVIGEKPFKPPGYGSDRAFLFVGPSDAATGLRRAGYPVAVLKLPARCTLSRYMQFIHYVVFGIGYLRRMNFVTQPSVELYKSIANTLHAEAKRAGGIEKTVAWREFTSNRVKWHGISLHGDFLFSPGATAPQIYAMLLSLSAELRQIEYGELTFFGDTRYSPQGQHIRRSLDRAAARLFQRKLKMPCDVYEGPAMNHSYHEMIIGHGKCFSTVLLSDKQETIRNIDYQPGYHMTQFLATKLALERKGRQVVALTVRDLSERTLAELDNFFDEAAASIG
jgi:glucose-6-phosphate isomerase